MNDLGDATTSSTSLLLGTGVSSNSTKNTVVGQNAGAAIDSSKNTYVGNAAGRYIEDEENTGIGNQALGGATGSNQTGTIRRNTAVGDRSLSKLANGASDNTAVGTWSGENMTTATGNTLVGRSSGSYLTTGSNNTFLGFGVGSATSTTSGNTGVGYNALNVNIGTKNVAIGYEALDSNTTANKNTALGYQAGDVITTGENNICIGHNADASSATASNEITLGDSGITTFRIPGIGVTFGEGGADISGIVTAVSFSGSGANLTGVGTQGIDVQAQSLTVAGISTFNDDVKFTSATSGLGLFYDRSADKLKILEDGSDNTKLILGDDSSYSSYMQIYHDGGNSGIGYINYAGSNKMILSGNNIAVMNTARNENMLTAVENGAATLYHNNLTRLATSAEGIDVTGRTETDLLNVSGVSTFSGIATHIDTLHGQTLKIAGVSTFHDDVRILAGGLDVTGIVTAVGAEFDGTSHIKLPAGSTGQRPGSPTAGDLRYNSDDGAFEGYTDSWGAIGGGTPEVDTNVSSTSAVGVGSFATASFRSAEVVAQIVQIDEYQVGKYLMIHDGTTVTVIEQAAVSTGDSMIGSFDGAINGSNAELRVTMVSSGIATVTTKISTVTV